jgi:hypothetical protein
VPPGALAAPPPCELAPPVADVFAPDAPASVSGSFAPDLSALPHDASTSQSPMAASTCWFDLKTCVIAIPIPSLPES